MAGKGSAPGQRLGGRQKGSPNKVGADVRALARQYTTEAVEKLASIMAGGDSSAAQAMAADKLLDRGWGKAAQAMTGADGEGPVKYEYAIELRIIDPKSADKH